MKSYGFGQGCNLLWHCIGSDAPVPLDIADNFIGVEGATLIGASFKGSVRKLRAAVGDRSWEEGGLASSAQQQLMSAGNVKPDLEEPQHHDEKLLAVTDAAKDARQDTK